MKVTWKWEIVTPATNGEWIQVPLKPDLSREAVMAISKGILREEGVWDSRIIVGNPCLTDRLRRSAKGAKRLKKLRP